MRSSLENLVDCPDSEPLVTFPDDTPSEELELDLLPANKLTNGSGELCLSNGTLGMAETLKFEEKRVTSASKTKVITDGFSSEQVKKNILLYMI